MGLGIGGDDFYQSLGFGALQSVARLQDQRNNFNKQMKAQHQANELGGALGGAAIGAEVGGPWGAAAGGVIGLLGGSFI
jgi:hypothetical protein